VFRLTSRAERQSLEVPSNAIRVAVAGDGFRVSGEQLFEVSVQPDLLRLAGETKCGLREATPQCKFGVSTLSSHVAMVRGLSG